MSVNDYHAVRYAATETFPNEFGIWDYETGSFVTNFDHTAFNVSDSTVAEAVADRMNDFGDNVESALYWALWDQASAGIWQAKTIKSY